MAVVQVNIPDTVMPRVLDAFAQQYGYRSTVPDPVNPGGPEIPNPETKSQFARRKIQDFIKGVVRASEAILAAETARTAAAEKADNEITIT